MGIVTLAQFQADLIYASGNRSLDATRSARWINASIVEFAYAFEFPELQEVATIPTIQGTRSYALPANYRSMQDYGVRIITPENRFGGILEKESRTQYLRSDRYPQTSAQNIARFYHIFQKKIWLRPAPDSTVTTIEFDYRKRVAPLAAAGDVSPFDEDWDEIIFRGALYRMHLSLGEHDRMINVFNLYLADIKSRVMAEDLEEFPEGGISYIQGQFDNLRR